MTINADKMQLIISEPALQIACDTKRTKFKEKLRMRDGIESLFEIDIDNITGGHSIDRRHNVGIERKQLSETGPVTFKKPLSS